MVTAAPNATYPVITGTATTAPASREISRKPSLATSFAFMGASVHRPAARVPLPRRPPAVRVRVLDTLQHGSVGRPACGAACEAGGRPYDDEGPEGAPDHECAPEPFPRRPDRPAHRRLGLRGTTGCAGRPRRGWPCPARPGSASA